MQWIPPLVTASGVIVAMITFGWQVYSKIDSKIDRLREETQTGFREVDRRFVEMITAMGSVSERVTAVEVRSERDAKQLTCFKLPPSACPPMQRSQTKRKKRNAVRLQIPPRRGACQPPHDEAL